MGLRGIYFGQSRDAFFALDFHFSRRDSVNGGGTCISISISW